MKNLRKLTVLLFVAATMFTFASCSKDDDASVSEANLVGEWGWPSGHEMNKKTIIINADHTGAGTLMNGFEWTLNDNKFVATARYINYRLEMTIKSIDEDKMEVKGQFQLVDSDGNVLRVANTATGTLIKTVTKPLSTLTESLMTGSWHFESDDRYFSWDLLVSADGTYNRGGFNGTWSISGTEFNMIEGEGNTSISVESMTSSASRIILTGVWTRPYSGLTAHGKLTKNL